MNTLAVVLEEPERLVLSRLPLPEPGEEDVVVDIEWSGITTGTERLLWSGRMPPFPGMGYPLVPGYESVGRIREAGSRSGAHVGDRVFVPGARCYGEIKGLFGGAASRVVVPGAKATRFDEALGEQGVLLALAATAYHALDVGRSTLPQLIVGHGVLGRLIARLVVAVGGEAPVVWETNIRRAAGAEGYTVIDPADRYAPRLRLDLRRQRRLETARHAHRQALARRRNRARRLLQRAAVLRLSARLHARGAPARRRRVERRTISPPFAISSRAARCRSTA